MDTSTPKTTLSARSPGSSVRRSGSAQRIIYSVLLAKISVKNTNPAEIRPVVIPNNAPQQGPWVALPRPTGSLPDHWRRIQSNMHENAVIAVFTALRAAYSTTSAADTDEWINHARHAAGMMTTTSTTRRRWCFPSRRSPPPHQSPPEPTMYSRIQPEAARG